MTSFELNGMRPLCFIGAGADADAAPGVLWCLMKALALYHRIAIQIGLSTVVLYILHIF